MVGDKKRSSSDLNSAKGLGIFLFTTASRTAVGPTQPSIQQVTGALSLGVKRPVQCPNMPSWRAYQLKHRKNFTFYLYIQNY
jgi:hypothetical protein